MAQPNANREPTMEEILASIRRIIENNDVSDGQQSRSFSSGTGDGAEALEEEMTTAGDTAAAEQDNEEHPSAAVASAAAGGSGSGPVSLAEVAARVRASGSSAALLRPSAPVAALVSAPTRGNAAVRLDEDLREEEHEEAGLPDMQTPAAAAEGDEGGALSAATEPESSEDDDVGEDETALESELKSVLRAAESTLPTSVANEPGTSAQQRGERSGRRAGDHATRLISASAGAKVAAAFGDLNEAFAAGPRRSFDEIAEEMLRPLLQQWLDDNLPGLVERLVREEIERVARGGHR